jgi:two-component system NtrC family sensor kinase
MPKAYQVRITAVLLALITVAACVLAAVNFQHESSFDVPWDGGVWVESTAPDASGLYAERIPADSPAARAGIKRGDILISVNDLPTTRLASLEREVFRTGSYSRANYALLRPTTDAAGKHNTVRLDTQVILEPADRSIHLGFRLIAMVYLCIGIYVLFRRWTAPKSTHFYIFCLISFILYSFKYTGELDTFDWVIYWCNIFANALQPALFLHFAATFTDEHPSPWRKRAGLALIYLPGILLVVGLQLWAVQHWSATEELRHRLDQIDIGYLALYYVIAAVVFYVSYRRAEMPLLRQQLKWLTRGTILAVTPFTLLYVIPYLSDMDVSSLLTKLAGLSLVFLPLTFIYAIVR